VIPNPSVKVTVYLECKYLQKGAWYRHSYVQLEYEVIARLSNGTSFDNYSIASKMTPFDRMYVTSYSTSIVHLDTLLAVLDRRTVINWCHVLLPHFLMTFFALNFLQDLSSTRFAWMSSKSCCPQDLGQYDNLPPSNSQLSGTTLTVPSWNDTTKYMLFTHLAVRPLRWFFWK